MVRVRLVALIVAALGVTVGACQRPVPVADGALLTQPPTLETTTSATTTLPTTTTTTTSTTTTTAAPAATLPGDVSVASIVGDDPALPMKIDLPSTGQGLFFDDVMTSWAAAERSRFEAAARHELAARQQAAAEAAAQAAAEAAAAEAAAIASSIPLDSTSTTTTTTTVPLPPPTLTVTHEPAERRDHYLLVRVHSSTDLGHGASEQSTVMFVAATGEVLPAVGLITADRWDELAGLVVTGLGDRAGDWGDARPDQVLTDMVIGEGGELVVTVAARWRAPGSASDPVVIGPEVVTPMLSAFGRSVLADQPIEPGPLPDDVDCAERACVALTFDDGPSQQTPRLLDTLAKAGAPATFFMLGQNVDKHPDIVARAVADGHAIGTHSWSHTDYRTLIAAQQADDLGRTETVIQSIAATDLTWFRPPYGRYNDDTRWLGRTLALWDVDTRDWEHRRPDRTVSIGLDLVEPGSIILLHDLHAASVDAVPLLIADLRAAGFELVTLSQLTGPVEPGEIYRSRTDHDDAPPPTTLPPPTTTAPSTDPASNPTSTAPPG